MLASRTRVRERFLIVCALLLPVVASCSLPGVGCLTSLDQDTLDRLTFSLDSSLQTRPGGTIELQLGTLECCVYFEPVDTCVDWSVEPSDGADINREGLLSIDDDAPHGAVFVVTADVENGRRLLSTDVHIYDPARNPLIGTWREVSQIDCATGEEVPVERPIGELRFRADGRVSVTWVPFETYVDYWSRYRLTESGDLSLSTEGGNFLPQDVDLEGRFTIDESGDLLLQEMWLGSHLDSGTPTCGHRFTR